ncbi:unnamed protein product [Euphydryas editha]|uniref:Retroviral polymerase SH3-like domain-containing protein n=1 Tax=Euphydryas editha TaxID=104508 RepID=A0AAU9TUV0_EUPED|nr:unnamed protein product [Euphydryas editha]
MLHEANLPKKLWAEAINTAVFVLNRTGKSHENGRSPFEVWTNKKFDIHQLRAFGTEVYVHIPKERRKKWDKKGEKGLMVGYEEDVKGYRIYFTQTNKVEIKRDIVFLNKDCQNEKLQVQEGKEKQSTVSIDLEKDFVQDYNRERDVDEFNPVRLDEATEVTHTFSDVDDGSECDNGSEYLPCSDEEHLVEVNLWCDNQSAILNACTESIKRLKHVDIRYHFVKELIKNNKICIKYISSCNQLADMLTKPISKEITRKYLKQCGVGDA